MNRTLRHQTFGGTNVLELIERDVPIPSDTQIRVRVTVAGLNPVDWQILASEELAATFGVEVPSGFGNDFAGRVDAVGNMATGWSVGDRVFGGARGAAVADYLIVSATDPKIHQTPEGIDDLTAGVVDIVGRTASAVADALNVNADDTVLISTAAGGVGAILTQLAVAQGSRVLGTGSASSANNIRALGAEPVKYGPGLTSRVRQLAPQGITVAADLYSTATAVAAIELGAPAARVVTIESENPPPGVRAVNGADARPGALHALLDLVLAGELRIPIAATYPLENYRTAVEHQRARHTHGKVAILIEETLRT